MCDLAFTRIGYRYESRLNKVDLPFYELGLGKGVNILGLSITVGNNLILN